MKRLSQIFQALLGIAALILTAIVAAGRLAWRTIRNWWKSNSKWIRRSIVTIFVVLPVGFVALVAYLLYEDKCGRDYWDRKLSENISLHSFANKTWRVYNRTTNEYMTDRINWVSSAPENDSLAVYALPHKRGYINVNTGRIVIDAETNGYRKAWVFSEGLAAVMKDGKIGFINAQNEVVIPFKFDYSDECCRNGTGFLFHNGYCVMSDADGALGFIDKGGNWVVEPSYDGICAPDKSGYRVVIKDNKRGVIDADLAVVYPAEYGAVKITPDGFVLAKGGRQWQVDFEGKIVQPFMFNATYNLKYPNGYDSSGEVSYVLADFVMYEVMGRFGIMNRITGKPITPAIYSDINMLSKELFEVKECGSDEWYLLDTKGNVVSKR
jgi:hypothetical protein